MKIKTAHISNSSTLSVIVQTQPTILDGEYEDGRPLILTLNSKKVALLKKCGFVPTEMRNPFLRELGTFGHDWDEIKADTKDDTYLGYWMSCNHDFVLQFLVAYKIPFKAAVHYSQYLYSYDPRDEEIYILKNFGIDYLHNPKELENDLQDKEMIEWKDNEPLRKISREEFLERYDEEESLKMMGVEQDNND